MRHGDPDFDSTPRLTDSDVREVTFRKPPFGRRGYDEEEVDNFLDLVAEALSARGSRLTADDIHNASFRKPPIGKRGYDEEEVDSFLDLAERELVRRQSAPGPSPRGGPPQLPPAPPVSSRALSAAPPMPSPPMPGPPPPPMATPMPAPMPTPMAAPGHQRSAAARQSAGRSASHAPPQPYGMAESPQLARSAAASRSHGASVSAPPRGAGRGLDPGAVVRAIWQRTESRDWHGVAELIDPAFVCEWPESRERFMGREAWITMNVNYPSDWHIAVDDIVAQGESVASRVRVTDENGVFHACSFWILRDSRAVRLTEYYVREGSAAPPEWRAQWAQRY